MNHSMVYDTRFGQVHALRWGHGEHLLLALHGFSDRAELFAPLAKQVGGHYTVIALDLPFHGRTTWQKDHFSTQDLLEIIAQVLEKEGKTRFSLAAFSFGARLAHAMLPALASQLDKCVLISPDGIRTKGLGLAERTPMWLRKWLQGRLGNPAWLLRLFGWGRTLGFVSAYAERFLRKNLRDPERRKRIFGCWLSMDYFRCQPIDIQRTLKEYALPTDVFLGEKDPLLSRKAVEKYYGNPPNFRLFVLPNEGHGMGVRICEKVRM